LNKKLPKIIGGLVIGLMLIGIAGATIAYAQDGTPPTPPADGQFGRHGLGDKHGFLRDAELTAAAEALGMTTDELSTELQNGKTLEELAEEAGVDYQVVQDAISAARAEEMRQWIEQSVTDGTISQEKADWLLEGLEKGFLDGPGFGFGFKHGLGGPPPADSTQTAPTQQTP
jgi:transcriptional regulator with XRE-family HTH domain